ncbi:MAG: four helix bundle protein [Paludibacteraceae bacterium]|nr:four helix bundle protein [Paludibacteraceae bacterium]
MYGLGNLGDKVTNFTTRVVHGAEYLKNKKAFTLADQFYRSGTSIGANCSEAVGAQTKADYLTKLHIALKEANETSHWIDVMYTSKLIQEDLYKSLRNDCSEICKILTTITKKLKLNIENKL